MQYGGKAKIDLGWGRKQRHKGFLVRFMDWINETYPHADHLLTNVARGGNALQSLAPCVFGTLPARVDLAVVEVGSMAKFLDLKSIELVVRRFLSLPSPPEVLFVTLPMWYGAEFEPLDAETRASCQWRFAQGNFGLSNMHLEMTQVPQAGLNSRAGRALSARASTWRRPTGPRHMQHERRMEQITLSKLDELTAAHRRGVNHFGLKQRNVSTPWSRAEAEVNRVCRHYGQSCLSVYRALAPAVAARREGFSIAEIAKDCVHPMHGVHGDAYVADLMVHWVLAPAIPSISAASPSLLPSTPGRKQHKPAAAEASATPAYSLPLPLRKANRHEGTINTACYYLHADGDRQRADADDTWLVAPWRVARCDDVSDDADGSGSGGSGGGSGKGVDQRCRPLQRLSCPKGGYAAVLSAWRSQWSSGWPDGWVYCARTISPSPRMMKNLAAFSPGALAYVTLAMPGFLKPALGKLAPAAFPATVKLLHLVSYEHMGVARINCVKGCTCRPTDVDAHRHKPGERNVSVYVEASLDVNFTGRVAASDGSRKPCVVALRMLKRTSSGEHRWVLTRATVSNPERRRGGN